MMTIIRSELKQIHLSRLAEVDPTVVSIRAQCMSSAGLKILDKACTLLDQHLFVAVLYEGSFYEMRANERDLLKKVREHKNLRFEIVGCKSHKKEAYERHETAALAELASRTKPYSG